MVVPAHLLAGALAAPVAGPSAGAAAGLTGREREVLTMMGRGSDTRGIARELGISLHTCRGYIKSILAKLGAHSQLEAVMTAIQLGLFNPAGRP